MLGIFIGYQTRPVNSVKSNNTTAVSTDNTDECVPEKEVVSFLKGRRTYLVLIGVGFIIVIAVTVFLLINKTIKKQE